MAIGPEPTGGGGELARGGKEETNCIGKSSCGIKNNSTKAHHGGRINDSSKLTYNTVLTGAYKKSIQACEEIGLTMKEASPTKLKQLQIMPLKPQNPYCSKETQKNKECQHTQTILFQRLGL